MLRLVHLLLRHQFFSLKILCRQKHFTTLFPILSSSKGTVEEKAVIREVIDTDILHQDNSIYAGSQSAVVTGSENVIVTVSEVQPGSFTSSEVWSLVDEVPNQAVSAGRSLSARRVQ